MNVKIVWGGWSCVAGYIDWAYVCSIKEVEPRFKGMVVDGFRAEDTQSIDERLYQPSNSLNGEKGDPKQKCKQWCEENNHKILGYIKLRTD